MTTFRKLGSVSGAGGISGGLKYMAKGLFENATPAMNTVLTTTISGLSGSGTDFAMELLSMAVFGDGIDWENIDVMSILQSGAIGMIQGFTESRKQNRMNREMEELQKQIEAGVAEAGSVNGQEQPTATDGDGQGRNDADDSGRKILTGGREIDIDINEYLKRLENVDNVYDVHCENKSIFSMPIHSSSLKSIFTTHGINGFIARKSLKP
jgi:hypothetical protein